MKKRILYVDDEVELTSVWEDVLEALGYEVSTFNSSKAALKKFRETPREFDLVITDYTMPEIGFQSLFRVFQNRGD